jgi:hypothetical protein
MTSKTSQDAKDLLRRVRAEFLLWRPRLQGALSQIKIIDEAQIVLAKEPQVDTARLERLVKKRNHWDEVVLNVSRRLDDLAKQEDDLKRVEPTPPPPPEAPVLPVEVVTDETSLFARLQAAEAQVRDLSMSYIWFVIVDEAFDMTDIRERGMIIPLNMNLGLTSTHPNVNRHWFILASLDMIRKNGDIFFHAAMVDTQYPGHYLFLLRSGVDPKELEPFGIRVMKSPKNEEGWTDAWTTIYPAFEEAIEAAALCGFIDEYVEL